MELPQRAATQSLVSLAEGTEEVQDIIIISFFYLKKISL